MLRGLIFPLRSEGSIVECRDSEEPVYGRKILLLVCVNFVNHSASKVLVHLGTYEYASIQHVAITLTWHTMMRVGGVHAPDADDYDPDDQCVKVRYRPESGTPMKNQVKAERMVALSDQLCDVLDDWLAEKRPSVTDEYGREPLLASREGRTNKTTLRAYVYRWTRPYSSECPHDRDLGEFGIHGKVQTIGRPEEGAALLGSANFMENSYDWNPECGVYTERTQFVNTAIEFFEIVWDISSADEIATERLQDIPNRQLVPTYYS